MLEHSRVNQTLLKKYKRCKDASNLSLLSLKKALRSAIALELKMQSVKQG